MFEPYELESGPAAPTLPGSVLLRDSTDDAIAAAAADLMLQAHACVRAFGEFHLALDPAPHTRDLLLRLLTDPNYRELPWSRTHLWSARSPRDSHPDDPHAPEHLAEIVLHGSDLPEDQWHPAPAHLPDGDTRYEAEICHELARREPGHDRFDCLVYAVLGVKTQPELAYAGLDDPLGRLVGPLDEPGGIALTARAARGGRLVMVLAPGRDAGPAIRHASEQPESVGITPVGGQLRWYLDREACGYENLE